MFISVLALVVFLFCGIPLLMSSETVKAFQDMWTAHFKRSVRRSDIEHKDRYGADVKES